ncbi:MAG: ferritin family protein [Thermodesulfobacteriota bacterium]
MANTQCRSIADAVKFAIDREEKAREFYLQCMGRAKNPGVKEFFREMADEEAYHRQLLADLDISDAAVIAPEGATDLHVGDYLVDVAFSPEMGYQEALAMAMKKEEKAYAFYAAWQNRCGDARISDVFAFLAGEEKKHKHKIEHMYENEILQWD